MFLKYVIVLVFKFMVTCCFSAFNFCAYGFFIAFEKSYSSLILSPSFVILICFLPGSFSRRDDSDDFVAHSVTMAYHQDVCCFTKSKNYESILFFRMIRIITHQGVVIIEDARSLFKRYAVFFNVYLCFFGIPLNFIII